MSRCTACKHVIDGEVTYCKYDDSCIDFEKFELDEKKIFLKDCDNCEYVDTLGSEEPCHSCKMNNGNEMNFKYGRFWVIK